MPFLITDMITDSTRGSKFITRINKKFTLPSPYLTERPLREANAIKLEINAAKIKQDEAVAHMDAARRGEQKAKDQLKNVETSLPWRRSNTLTK